MAKILVVDDEKIIRKRMKSLLELDGYETFTAENGEKGLEIFREENPEIVLADIKMPGISGTEVLRQIKEAEKDTEVIMITGHGGIDTAIEALKKDAFGYLQKPIDYDELEVEIKKALKKQELQKKLDGHVRNLEEAVEEKKKELNRRKYAEEELQKAHDELDKRVNERTAELQQEITERKQAENLFQVEHARFKTILEVNPNGIYIVDQQHNIEYINPVIKKQFGPVGSRKCYEYFHDRTDSCPWCNNEEVFAGKSVWWEWYSKKNNRYYDLFDTAIKNSDGSFSKLEIFNDITERKKREEDFIKIKTALDSASDAIGMTDANLKIIYQNRSFLNMFGYTAEEIEKMDISEGYRDADFAKKGVHALKDGKTWEGEAQIRSKDGRDPVCFLSASPIFDDTGNIIGYFSRHTDITERKKMEERVLQAEKLKSLGELAGGVAHDFNNVLAAILGRAQLLKVIFDPPPGKEERRKSMIELKEGLDVIERASRDGAETVRRIQEFARRRDDDKQFSTVNLNEIIANALEFTRMNWKDNAESKGIKINVQKELSTLPATSGSAAELREVVTNLINNAVDAMPQGGEIKIKTCKEDSYIVVEVADTGSGIPKALRNKIFDPFFTTKGVQSTGLGMSVSYGIIRRHRGTISIDSIEGEGSTFTIKLPISEKTIEEEKEKCLESKPGKARIMVIEDEEKVRNLLTAILKKGGHEVEMVSDGNQGIEMFKKKEFDLVFTDLGMPGMSGWQVAEKVKSINKRVPVVLITGWEIKQEASEMKDSYVDLIIHKPFEMEQVLNVVQEGMILRDRSKTI